MPPRSKPIDKSSPRRDEIQTKIELGCEAMPVTGVTMGTVVGDSRGTCTSVCTPNGPMYGAFDPPASPALLPAETTIARPGCSGVTNSLSARIENHGDLRNYGLFVNGPDAEVTNEIGAFLQTNDLFENWDDALLVNDGEFSQTNILKNYCAGDVENGGTWWGGFDNYDGGYVNNGVMNGAVVQHGCVHKP